MGNSLQTRSNANLPRVTKRSAWWTPNDEETVCFPEEVTYRLGAERDWTSALLVLGQFERPSRSDADVIEIWHSAVTRSGAATATKNLRERLANANDHFRRKADEVFNDESALRLLAGMYQEVVVEISNFDSCENGIPLAKLTAANFCEVGASSIYITEAGQRFIDSIEGA